MNINSFSLQEEVRKASRNIKKKPRTTTTTTPQPPFGLGFLLNLFGGNSNPRQAPATARPPKRTKPKPAKNLNGTRSSTPDPLKEPVSIYLF